MIGSGCSPATEPTAENSHYYNITHVRNMLFRIVLSTLWYSHDILFHYFLLSAYNAPFSPLPPTHSYSPHVISTHESLYSLSMNNCNWIKNWHLASPSLLSSFHADLLCLLLYRAGKQSEVSLLLSDVADWRRPCTCLLWCHSAVWVEEGGAYCPEWKPLHSGMKLYCIE